MGETGHQLVSCIYETQDLWSYQYITELNKAGVLPSSEKFQGQEEETRGNLVLYLYNMDQGVFKDRKKSRDKKKEKAAPNFTDVTKDSPYYDAALPDPGAGVHRCGPVCGPGGDLSAAGGGARPV